MAKEFTTMKNPLINILVRTSNRPNFFAKCYQSIREQTYKNIRLIVSYDDEFTKEYTSGYETDSLVGFKRTTNWAGKNSDVFVPGHISKPFLRMNISIE